jgi:TonB family protein
MIRSRFTIALAVALASAPTDAAAQDVPAPEPGLLRVAAAPDGTVLSLDSASISRFGEATYEVTALHPYSPALAQQYGFDRLLESQQVDCAGNRERDMGKHAFRGATEQRVENRNSQAEGAWVQVGPGELPLLQAICGTLQRSFAAALPLDYELSEVETQPSLVNRADVQRSLAAEYPLLLRNAGVSGTVTMRMRLLPDGSVDTRSIRVEQSTHDAFAQSARRVAAVMRFTPARAKGEAVPVWVTLPLVFEVLATPRTTVSGNPFPTPDSPSGSTPRTTRVHPGQSPSTCSLPPPACGAP